MKYLLLLLVLWASNVMSQTVPIIVYHHISDKFPLSHTVITCEKFIEQIDTLRAMGYTTVTINELVKFVKGTISLPQKSIAITFDDGWKDQHCAANVLSQRNMSATFYVMSGKFNDERYFSEKDLLTLAENPLFEIGSHSHTHMTEYEDTLKLDVRILIGEMMMSRVILEQLIKRPVGNYAWPYGAYTAESVQLAEKLGFLSTAMINPTSNNSIGTSPMTLQRLNIDGSCSIEKFRTMIETRSIMECK